MINVQNLKDKYPILFEEELLNEISKQGLVKHIPEGQMLQDIGDFIKHMPLLIDGTIKIIREDDNGREVLLYYLERGDTCAFALTCCMNNQRSEVRAITEEECEIIMIPTHFMEEWLIKYPTWRSYVFQSYNTRLNELLETIDSIAFLKMDQRLMKYLKDKVMVLGSTDINITHKEIAQEMNSSRVVISRLLKQLEKEDKIIIKRNQIEILNF